MALADHPTEKHLSLLAIAVSQLAAEADVQLELGLGLPNEALRPGSRRGLARSKADRAVDAIRARFGWEAVGYGAVTGGAHRSVPDAFRELAERDL